MAMLVGSASSALAALPHATRSVEAYSHGGLLKFPPSYLAKLGHHVEQLAIGSWFAEQSALPKQTPELHILVKYERPLSLSLPTREHQTIRVRQIELSVSVSTDGGWPVLFASTADTSWILTKYSGPLVLDIFCS